MRVLPEVAYRPMKKFMDSHYYTHMAVHRFVCPIIKFDENRNSYEERRV